MPTAKTVSNRVRHQQTARSIPKLDQSSFGRRFPGVNIAAEGWRGVERLRKRLFREIDDPKQTRSIYAALNREAASLYRAGSGFIDQKTLREFVQQTVDRGNPELRTLLRHIFELRMECEASQETTGANFCDQLKKLGALVEALK
jgi:hypothetical protein